MAEAKHLDVLLVDDESLARRGIRILLREELGITSVREASSGAEAIAAIRARRPDLVFLDVQLGDTDGFSVIESLGVRGLPPIIFVTAYDRYALRAFEVHAVDYLLKPVNPDRLRDAVEHAMLDAARDDRSALRRALDSASRMMAELRSATDGKVSPAVDDRIVVREGARTAFLRRDEIDWVEAAGNYVRVHMHDRGVMTHRSTLDAFEEDLGAGFVRIRRAVLVRRNAISTCEALGKGSYAITLADRTRLTSSRYFRDRMTSLVGR